jgi:ribosome-associated protein YbcJ (S4-like RNA binding protein)
MKLDAKKEKFAEVRAKKKRMEKMTLEKFSVTAIADQSGAVGVESARSILAVALGSVLEVSGKVQKVVKRDGLCKLVIESDKAKGFTVFADCPGELETVRNSKIRKGSTVAVRGRLQSFGGRAVCLSDCRMQGNSKENSREIAEK